MGIQFSKHKWEIPTKFLRGFTEQESTAMRLWNKENLEEVGEVQALSWARNCSRNWGLMLLWWWWSIWFSHIAQQIAYAQKRSSYSFHHPSLWFRFCNEKATTFIGSGTVWAFSRKDPTRPDSQNERARGSGHEIKFTLLSEELKASSSRRVSDQVSFIFRTILLLRVSWFLRVLLINDFFRLKFVNIQNQTLPQKLV